MKFTKANINFAKRNGLELDIDYDETQTVMIFEHGEEEPLIVYSINVNNDELFYTSQVYGDKIEDLPHWIKSSKELNSVVKYISKELDK